MYIKVRVTAKASKEKIEKTKKDEYKISVREKAEQNMANRRVCEIIAGEFSLPIKAVRIISGHHSPSKILSLKI